MKKIIIITIIICFVLVLLIIYNKYQHRDDIYKMNRLVGLTGKEKFIMIEKMYPLIFKKLRIGISKNEVMLIIGYPQNVDSDNIWYWSYSNTFDKEWIDLYWEDKTGYYIIFLNNKLICSIYNIYDVDPIYLLECKGYSKSYASKIIGTHDFD